jgi:hypothetical protein
MPLRKKGAPKQADGRNARPGRRSFRAQTTDRQQPTDERTEAMPIDVHPRRQGRTPEEITQQQKEDAARQRQQQAGRPGRHVKVPPAAANVTPPASVPVKATAAALATNAVDTRTPHQRYLDEVAPTAIVGRLIKFSKDGVFVTSDDEQTIDVDTDFYALCDELQVGWIKYAQEEGDETQRVAGLHYDGFELPPRVSLGDLDESEWPLGLSGQVEDPWKHFQNLVLERVDTRELFTFSTATKTGRRGVGNLLRHYDRLQRAHPGDVPVVRCRPGGYNHKDPRIGWVPTPTFCVVGHAPRNVAATPDTSPGGDMNDEIPI